MGDTRSRHEQRAAFDLDTRVTLLEHDADEREAGERETRRQNLKLFLLAFGGTITFAAAAVMLALNLAVK